MAIDFPDTHFSMGIRMAPFTLGFRRVPYIGYLQVYRFILNSRIFEMKKEIVLVYFIKFNFEYRNLQKVYAYK